MITMSRGFQGMAPTLRSVNFMAPTNQEDMDQTLMTQPENGLSTVSASSCATADAMIDEALQTSVYQIVKYIKLKIRYRKLMKHRKKVIGVLRELHSLSVTIHGRMALADLANDDDSGLDLEIRRLFYMLVQTAPIGEWANRN